MFLTTQIAITLSLMNLRIIFVSNPYLLEKRQYNVVLAHIGGIGRLLLMCPDVRAPKSRTDVNFTHSGNSFDTTMFMFLFYNKHAFHNEQMTMHVLLL